MPQKSYGGFGPTGYLPPVFSALSSAYDWYNRRGPGPVSSSSSTMHHRRRYPPRRYGGFGGGKSPALGSAVSRQRDLVVTGTKRKSKRLRNALKYKKKKWLRYKRKVKKAVSPPRYKVKFYHNASRSWMCTGNAQGCALIPILGYRGVTAPTISNGANVPGTPNAAWTFAQNQVREIRNYYDNTYVVNNAGSNKKLIDYWFKIPKSHVDITITNTGSSADLDGSNQPVEYEIWLYWPGKARVQDDRDTTLPDKWMTIGRDVAQTLQDSTAAAFSIALPSNNAWATFVTTGAKEIVRSKLLGRGYLAVGESTRFTKSYKCKYLFTNEKYTRDSTNFALNTWHLRRGVTAGIMVTWRGTQQGPTRTGGTSRGRLTFMCTWTWDTYTSGERQSGSFDQYLYGGDDYA